MAVVDQQAEVARGQLGGPSLARRFRWFNSSRLLITPALIFAVLVTQAPFVLTLYYSTLRWNLLRPETKGFVGLENYRRILFDDDVFRTAILNTLVFTVGVVTASMLLGLFYAELVNHRFPGRGIVRTMLITPFLVMPVVTALSWKYTMFDPDFGIIDWVLREVQPGNSDWNPVWLSHYPKESIIIMLVWRWAPFMMLILLAGMQSIDEEVREAARVDGATALQEFFGITLPHLYRYMQLGALLGTVYIVQEFDAIFMTTQGGPGTATMNLSFMVYRRAIAGSNVGYGAALGVVIVALTIVAMTLILRVLDRMMRGAYEER
ncbi:MAG: carbohydrate ABC transporter permease [Thermomicrobiales bacterium]